jgi:hypothetical protein
MTPNRYYVLLAASLMSLAFSGCGKGLETYPVQGKVQFANGKPLVGGSVEFLTRDAEGKAVNARGAINDDGTFQVKTRDQEGAIAGKHQIVVMPVRVDAVSKTTVIPPNPLDPRFGNYATSGLSFTVEAKPENNCVLTVKAPAASQ